MRSRFFALVAILSLSTTLASGEQRAKKKHAGAEKRATETARTDLELAITQEYTYRVVASWPHDSSAFTQGLIYRDGQIFESTGLYGDSSLREVDPETGAVLRLVDVPRQYFAEGLTELGGKLYQLTWQNGVGFVYDAETFAKTGEFRYTGEGWGITHDGESLVMSDGTSTIRFLDPTTFEVERTIDVTWRGAPVARLNELEYIHGLIYANVWLTDTIVAIDPATGRVVRWIDMSGLLQPYDPHADVLNGIAYDAENDRILVTGKLWPRLYEVEFVPRS
jgi:glutamine cyclotransferase